MAVREQDPATVPRVVRRLPRVPRRLFAALAMLLVLAIVAVGATGFAYSRELTAVDHHLAAYDETVLASAPGTLTLARNPRSERPGTYGLVWEGGTTVVGEVASVSATTVTRRLEGVAPPSGAPARLLTSVWESDPQAALGLRFRAVTVPGPLGGLPAWQVEGKGTRADTWAVLVHGRGGSRTEGLRVLGPLHDDGLTVLDVTYRNDAGAPSSPDHRYHLGDTEWRDVEAAVAYARGAGARRVVLVGFSMGGSLVSAFLDRSALAARVDAVVLDAPVLSWSSVLDQQARLRHLPTPLAAVAGWATEARLGLDLGDLGAAPLSRGLHVPLLLVHGQADDVVPPGSSLAFAAARPDVVTLVVTPYAGHVQSWNVDPAAYDERVTAFLDRVVP